MALPTRDERETCFLINDLGEITIWSISPTWIRRLTKRLGKPTSQDGPCAYWEGFTTLQVTIMPRKRRKRAPKGVS